MTFEEEMNIFFTRRAIKRKFRLLIVDSGVALVFMVPAGDEKMSQH